MSDSGFFSKNDFSFADTFTEIRLVYSSATGHTEVYSARKALKRFALKALKAELRKDPFYIGMLRKEFEIGFRLEHPFLIHTYSFEEVEGLGPCIVLEWIDGETMDAHIENKTLDEKTWRTAVTELCDALGYLERHQIVHRDIKPSNVMLTSDGNHVKLIDFGFSDSPEYGSLKHSGGTRDYAAPEQLSDSRISSTADIFALGKIMEAIPIKKNRSYRNLVCRMTSELSATRPQSAGEIKAEWNKAPGKNRINIFAVSAVLAALAIGAIVWIVPRKTEGPISIQADKVNEEINDQPFDSTAEEIPATEAPEIVETTKTVEPEKHISNHPAETAEPIPETPEPPVVENTKKVVHWMVILTAQQTQGTARKLIESGDSLWELHARQEVGEWVDSQTESLPELREDCHDEIIRIIENIKSGG